MLSWSAKHSLKIDYNSAHRPLTTKTKALTIFDKLPFFRCKVTELVQGDTCKFRGIVLADRRPIRSMWAESRCHPLLERERDYNTHVVVSAWVLGLYDDRRNFMNMYRVYGGIFLPSLVRSSYWLVRTWCWFL